MAINRMKEISTQMLVDCWHKNRSAQLIADDLGISARNLRYRWAMLKRAGKLPGTRKLRPADIAGLDRSYRSSTVPDPEPEDVFDGRPRSTEKINNKFLVL